MAAQVQGVAGAWVGWTDGVCVCSGLGRVVNLIKWPWKGPSPPTSTAEERFFILESGRLSWWSSDDHLGHPCRGCLDFVVNKGEVVLDVDDRAAFHLVPIDGGVWYAGSFTNATHGRALTLLVADSWMTRQAWVAAIHDHIEWCSRR